MELKDPNEYAANDSAEVRELLDDGEHVPENVEDYAGFLPGEGGYLENPDTPEPGPVPTFPVAIFEEDPVEQLLRQLVNETTAARVAAEATAQNTAVLASLFGEAVTVINALGEKADGLFSGSGDGPKLGGPAGMILSALIPKR